MTSVSGSGLEDLQGAGRDARDKRRLVPGVDVPVAVLGGLLLAVLAGLVEILPVEDHLGAQRLHRLHLDRVGLFGHADDGVHAEEAGRVGHRLAMVPGRSRDDAPPPLRRAELADQVHAAAYLEGAYRLMVLVLDPYRCAAQHFERGVVIERCRAQVRRDALARREHVSKIRNR